LGTGPTPQFAGVQVGWINEDQLGDRPLAMIGQVLEGMYGTVEAKEKVDVRILGPASSDTLLQMADENAKWTEDSWKSADPPAEATYAEATAPGYFTAAWHEATLISGRATISLEELTGGTEKKETRKAIDAVTAFVAGESAGCGLTVKRTIGDDSQLAALVATELQLRGAWPPPDDPEKGSRADGRRIVLITERDSSYGSLFAATLENALGKLVASRGGSERRQAILQEVTYLRGARREDPRREERFRRGTIGQKPDRRAPDRSASGRPISNRFPPAGGRSSIILRRLERQLVDLDRKGRERKEGGIVAVGVIGTDIYDKLLILRALRKHFPRTWFFRPTSMPSFRSRANTPPRGNSSSRRILAWRCIPTMQRTAPPFRNSYQTSPTFRLCWPSKTRAP